MTNGKIDKLWDNSENGNPNFSIILVNGQQLYVREQISANIGDNISYEEINHKTSAKGNPYVNVKNVKVDNQTVIIPNQVIISNLSAMVWIDQINLGEIFS